ncbi:hypothetical protein CEK26_011523 [Fusarium fujikuroi]|uniref:Uncharacterized protein n=1 Tax=Fusarium fujikuroi TaxID=5127 RepID=A0A5Q3DLA9_FUSFU|nr:hypothetical protein CEK27_011543 [Fusarium fujikuroi]QGI98454.1 hypothetical protein CEK26_011523 [Fusarium fujikuroi]VTT77058.1 unnamed protein product [Fusarium fujikuroi]VTT78024.1 unnamed protein product [Fusarium fujikuroi]
MGRNYLGGSGESLTVWISLAASTVLVFYGYDQGVFGNILVSKDFIETVGHPSVEAQGTMTSVYNLGCFGGALSTLYTGDKLGRPRSLIVGSLIIALGAIIQATVFGPTQMYVGRVVAGKPLAPHIMSLSMEATDTHNPGIGTGINTSTAGVWQSETAKTASRGKLIIIQMANCITGFSISNWLTLGFSFVPGSASWRFPLAFQIFFSALVCLMCPFLPDSPRLLMRKEKHEEALEVLAALEGHGATVDSPSVRTQYAIIKDIMDKERGDECTWWQLITGRGPSGAVRRMILGAWMQCMNQISGINVTSYYMTYVFINALGLSEFMARVLAAAGSIDYLVFSFLAWFVIERYGRRRVMMVSAAACAACWTIISIAASQIELGKGNRFSWGCAAIFGFFAFFAAFGMGVLAVPWLYPTEVNALAFRAKGASLAMASNWIMNYMVAQITPPGIANLGYRFWVIWAVICAAFVPITYLFYPETANRSLEDIDRFFAEHPDIFVFRNKTATQLARPEIYFEADKAIAEQQKIRGEVDEKSITSAVEKEFA